MTDLEKRARMMTADNYGVCRDCGIELFDDDPWDTVDFGVRAHLVVSGRRTDVQHSGSAFAAIQYVELGYNDRHELKAGDRWSNSGRCSLMQPSQVESTAGGRAATASGSGWASWRTSLAAAWGLQRAMIFPPRPFTASEGLGEATWGWLERGETPGPGQWGLEFSPVRDSAWPLATKSICRYSAMHGTRKEVRDMLGEAANRGRLVG